LRTARRGTGDRVSQSDVAPSSSVLRTKSVERSVEETEEPEHQLRRELSALSLTAWGIGVIVGTGIFVLTGVAAATRAGPAVSLSFVVAAIACALAALCYAEFASTVPVAGSAYTFSYATIGELVAWIIGWDLILEFALGASTVAVGWSGYFTSLLDDAGITLPTSVAGENASVNLPAIAIVLLITALLVTGIRSSARVNIVIVAIKLTVVAFVIVVGVFYVKTGNWDPFVPPKGKPEAGSGTDTTPMIQALLGQKTSTFGLGGIFTGAALVFFAFIGFDIVATAAEETKNPQRDMPIGILASLGICTVLYILVSLVVTGMVSYTKLDVDAPLAFAFKENGLSWASTLISIGALAGLTTVMMVLMYGQSRVAFAMSRDNLLPPALGQVHPTFRTPYRITIVVGVVVAALAGFISLDTLADLTNIGTLFAFILVSIAVVILRRRRPDLKRSFRVPLMPVTPVLAVLASFYLMLNLVEATWIRFGVWMAVGFVIYFLYGIRKSRLAPGRS
jgi:APA family basic amino acid/polyamine antiporter